MNNLLSNKNGLIFGALDENSIAWKVAERCNKEGANLVLTNAPIALRMGKIDILSKKCKSEVIPADVTSLDDLENLFIKSIVVFKFIRNSIHPIDKFKIQKWNSHFYSMPHTRNIISF